MKKKLIILLILILCIIPLTIAKSDELIIKTNQSEYYFVVGQNSVIPLDITNEYEKELNGIVSYTTSSQIQQGGFSYSSTNTNQQSFSIPKESGKISISLGTANNPTKIDFDFQFTYTDPSDEEMILTLPTITVYFVQKEEEKKENKQEQQSSCQSKEEINKEQEKQKEQQQKELEKQLKEQQKIEEVQNQMQNKLQNNQMNQNTQNLKNQMQKEIQEKNQLKKDFENNLKNKQEFKEKENELTKEGYKQTNSDYNSINSTNGEFKIKYENNQGQKQEITGSLKNNSINKIKSTLDDQKLLDMLRQNEKFKEYDSILQNKSFTESSNKVSTNENITNIKIEYKNQKNKTATITASIKNNTITKVNLDKPLSVFWIFLIIIMLILISYLIFKYKLSKRPINEQKQTISKKQVNYKKLAQEMLEKSKKEFNKKNYKDAYSLASSTVKFFYSHKLDLKKELTNSELILNLKEKKIQFEKTRKCLNICGLVEFAKYKPNKKDFDKIIKIAEMIIK
jgi:hypothetical protein